MTFSPLTFWLIIALVLAGCEMLTGTFYLLAIAAGALLGALAAWLGAPIGVQIVVIAIISLIAARLIKSWKKTHQPKEKVYPMLDLGQRITELDWKSERLARVKYRGSFWDAELAPEAQSGKNEYVIIEIKANTLILNNIKPEKE